MTLQTASLLLLVLVLLGSCSTVTQNLECECNPPVKEWLEAFKTGSCRHNNAQLLSEDVQKMEALKLTGLKRTGGMSALAEETRKKVEKRLAGEEE